MRCKVEDLVFLVRIHKLSKTEHKSKFIFELNEFAHLKYLKGFIFNVALSFTATKSRLIKKGMLLGELNVYHFISHLQIFPLNFVKES